MRKIIIIGMLLVRTYTPVTRSIHWPFRLYNITVHTDGQTTFQAMKYAPGSVRNNEKSMARADVFLTQKNTTTTSATWRVRRVRPSA
jgi:hypothetical protein